MVKIGKGLNLIWPVYFLIKCEFSKMIRDEKHKKHSDVLH